MLIAEVDHMAKSNIAIKYRIYPNEEQSTYFHKTFGCCRFVYNTMLSIQKELYDKNGFHLSKYDCFKFMTAEIKSRFSFLKEADSLALMNSVFALDDAYTKFFKQEADFPRFKSLRHSRKSYTTNNQNGTVEVLDKAVRLPKVGIIKAKIHRTAPDFWKIKQATVSQDSDGKYYCSILFEYTSSCKIQEVQSIDECLGLDFSERDMYVDNNGIKGNIPHYYKNLSKRLTREQHKLSRMIESNILEYKTVGNKRYPVYKKPLSECRNIQKQRLIISRLHKHIANQRRDFLHKRSNQITNDYRLICIEDISIKEMMMGKSDDASAIKRHSVNKKTLNNGWYMFTQMLTYKAEMKGGTVIKAPKDYPSTQICHCCNHQNTDINDISIKKWICPVCNTEHDRDINAAINIRNKGYQLYKSELTA